MEKIEYELLNKREMSYFWHVGRREILREALMRHLNKSGGHQILDIGCATGGNIFLLKEFGEITGLDNADEALQFAKARGITKLIKADATRIPLPDHSFDMVSGLDIFEHIPDDASAIQEAFRVLRPGGIFLVTVPAHPWLFSAHDKFLHHIRRYTKKEIVGKLRHAGFSVLEQSHFVTLGVPVNAFRKLRDKVMFGNASPSRSYDIIFKNPMNALMLFILRFEKLLIRYFSLPLGTSLMIVAKKPDAENFAKGSTQSFVDHHSVSFSKQDFWRAIIAGEAIAILSLPILKNINFFKLFPSDAIFLYLAFWLAVLPAASVSGLYLFYRISRVWRPVVFEIGKYGLIGWLNTFLNIGIFNLLVLVTGIAKGWTADFFLVVSFTITITHSFFWNKFWIFGTYRTNKAKSEYIRFFGITSATSLLNILLFHTIVNVIGAPVGIDPKVWANIALAILIPISFLGNFLGYRILVFKKQVSSLVISSKS